MLKKKERAIVVVGGIFTVSTTLGQVASIEQRWIQLAILIPNFFAWIYFAWIYYRYRTPLPSESQIKNRAYDKGELIYRHVRTATELDFVWHIDNEIYREFNVRKETLYEWYSRYKKGCLMMYRGQRFLGYVGIYPLMKESFEKLKKGELREDNIGTRDIYSDDDAANCSTWYFSGYALYEKKLFENMVSDALNRLANSIRSDIEIIEAVSFAVPGADAKFLEKIGFRQIRAKISDHELAIVYRTFDKKELVDLTDKLISHTPSYFSWLSSIFRRSSFSFQQQAPRRGEFFGKWLLLE